MAASRPKPGNHERGWNDPPMFSFSSKPGQQSGAPKRQLNKRVAFPASSLPPPGHAVLNPGQGPPTGNTPVHNMSAGIPIPKVVQSRQVGNSALPPALQEVTTAVVDQDAPLSPVLLPPTADTSMPVTVPLLVPTIVNPVRSQSDEIQDQAIVEERLADLLSRLQLQDDSRLLSHVTAEFETVKERYCKLLTEKACEDIHRKLEKFVEMWKKGSLSESVKVKITHLAAALLHEEVDKANHLHLALMVDHITEVNQWMMGIKRLIQQQQLLLKEKELSSEITNDSGEQNIMQGNTSEATADGCDSMESAGPSIIDNEKQTVEETGNESGDDRQETDVGSCDHGDNIVQTAVDEEKKVATDTENQDECYRLENAADSCDSSAEPSTTDAAKNTVNDMNNQINNIQEEITGGVKTSVNDDEGACDKQNAASESCDNNDKSEGVSNEDRNDKNASDNVYVANNIQEN